MKNEIRELSHSKSNQWLVVMSDRNPVISTVIVKQKNLKIWVLPKSSAQKFPEKESPEKAEAETDGEKSTRRSIEVVITSRTRNAVVRKGTWVRIPPSPPTKPVIAMVTGFWIFWKSLFLPDFQWAELLNTWAELLRFLKNTGCTGSKI